MPSFTLTDVADDHYVESFDLAATDLNTSRIDPDQPAWSVRKRTLRGGRRDGVDRIVVDNGALVVEILPTRGMGLWRGSFRGDRLGWDSPVVGGPVNPSFVRLEDRGGLGWLDGFDEWMVRCGLAHNGPPFEVSDPASPDPDAPPPRRTMHPLHGRIANTPAHFVAVHVEGDGSGQFITVEGRVAESTLFHPQLELTTRITTTPGSNRLVVRDSITNRSDRPGEFQLLYHWNFGPPYLGEGATAHAPIETLTPRDPRAAEGISTWATYEAPQPGFAEQAYYAHLIGTGPNQKTLAMLLDPTRSKAVVLRFARSELPCFTLWKNTGGPNDGYVTGLEPATNFPNPKAFEKARNRVVPLAPGATHEAKTTLEVLDTPEAVATILEEIEALQKTHPTTIHLEPTKPFAPQK